MVKEINGRLYKVNTMTKTFFVEAYTLMDLYQYVAQKAVDGYYVLSVTELESNGSTPRIPVLSTKEYKSILAKLQSKKRRTPVPGYKGLCPYCKVYYKLFDWSGETEKCPTCGRELAVVKEGATI